METLTAILMGIGLSAACGLRVFLPLAALSIGAKVGLVNPGESFAWVASWPALIAFSTACLVEINGYSIPWLDHALDTIATPASVLAGGVVSATHLSGTTSAELHPVLAGCTALIIGGAAAGAVQSGTVATRGVSTVTTAGLANPVISAVQSALAAFVSIVAVVVPVLAGVLALIMIVLIARWFFARRAARAAALLS